jgi:hypothetical protein
MEKGTRRRKVLGVGIALCLAISGVATAYYMSPSFGKYFDDLIKLFSPLIIKNLTWEPTRVVNSKVYAGAVFSQLKTNFLIYQKLVYSLSLKFIHICLKQHFLKSLKDDLIWLL